MRGASVRVHVESFLKTVFELSLPNKTLFSFKSQNKILSRHRTMEVCFVERLQFFHILNNTTVTTISVFCTISVIIFNLDRLGT